MLFRNHLINEAEEASPTIKAEGIPAITIGVVQTIFKAILTEAVAHLTEEEEGMAEINPNQPASYVENLGILPQSVTTDMMMHTWASHLTVKLLRISTKISRCQHLLQHLRL